MAKNLVNKEKLKVILEMYREGKISFEEASVLFEDSVETTWTYPFTITTTNPEDYGKDKTEA